MREYLHPFKIDYISNKIIDPYIKNINKKVPDIAIQKYTFPFYNIIFPTLCQTQGWKIHLSPILSDYDEVVNKVFDVLIAKKISFKFVPSKKEYLFMSDKNVSASQFAKYITVYPRSTDEFKNLIQLFYSLLQKFSGIKVLSDRQYRNCPLINYRYGGFFQNLEMNSNADLTYRILDGSGNLVEDQRNTFFWLPNGIFDPINKKAGNNLSQVATVNLKGSKTGHIYEIKNIVRRLGTGNIYEGINTFNKKSVIIKEARIGALPNEKEPLQRAINLKKNEMKMSNLLQEKGINNLSNVIDYFSIEGSFFIVEDKIDGTTLRHLVSSNPLVNISADSEELIKQNFSIKKIWSGILKLLTQIHKLGYCINDISDDNFMVSEKNEVYLIDLEAISPFKDNIYSKIRTVPFEINQPENLTNINSEYYKLSVLMMYFIFGKINGFLFDKGYFIKERKLLDKYLLPAQKDLYNLATQIMNFSKNNLFTLKNESDLIKPNNKVPLISTNDFHIELPEILKQIYHNYRIKIKNNSFSFTKYVGKNTSFSLAYGTPGILILLKKLKYFKSENECTKLLNKFRATIPEAVTKHSINYGLFFGLSGCALCEFYCGIPFEKNFSLNKLLRDQKNWDYSCSNLSNGLCGIAFCLCLISGKNNYPNFIKIISTLLNSINFVGKTDEGLEYGNLGEALLLISFYDLTKNKIYLEKAKKIADLNFSNYKDDKIFTGLSYNKKIWKNIRSPYLMSGSAGLLLIYAEYYQRIKEKNFNQKTLYKVISSLDLPYVYNYGINYGSAGLIFALEEVKKIGNLNKKIILKINAIIEKQKKFISVNFNVKNNWLGDGQTNFADDLGSGSLGIAYILSQLRQNNDKQTGNSTRK